MVVFFVAGRRRGLLLRVVVMVVFLMMVLLVCMNVDVVCFLLLTVLVDGCDVVGWVGWREIKVEGAGIEEGVRGCP